MVLEGLNGLMENVNSKNNSVRWKLARLAYRGLVYSIASKAVEYNAPIVFVDPRNTSSTCSMCGSRLGYVSRVAICTKCGLKMDRDSVGVINIWLKAVQAYAGCRGHP
ncbi:zinc ribbon domain-containing protein [Desulfurococcus amylolyticus]|uniref:zinc ribbon domain-containing protein n=1 Tax=Desulfurococcus amylolyticus TaxID=94694 RepID=UPI0030B7F970